MATYLVKGVRFSAPRLEAKHSMSDQIKKAAEIQNNAVSRDLSSLLPRSKTPTLFSQPLVDMINSLKHQGLTKNPAEMSRGRMQRVWNAMSKSQSRVFMFQEPVTRLWRRLSSPTFQRWTSFGWSASSASVSSASSSSSSSITWTLISTRGT